VASFRIAEVFGYRVENNSAEARRARRTKACPFRSKPCAKGSSKDPLGVCAITDGKTLAVTCPVRFLQDGLAFAQAAECAFGADVSYCAIPEVPFLHSDVGSRRLGKIDYVLARHQRAQLADYCALEIQAVYFEGPGIRQEFRSFLETAVLPEPARGRRPDYRSSSQKRLMPQLLVEVPVLRRWGKKVFIALDQGFFEWLPPCKEVDPTNAEITWLVYAFVPGLKRYEMTFLKAVPTTLDFAVVSLTAARAPARPDFEEEIQKALSALLGEQGSRG